DHFIYGIQVNQTKKIISILKKMDFNVLLLIHEKELQFQLNMDQIQMYIYIHTHKKRQQRLQKVKFKKNAKIIYILLDISQLEINQIDISFDGNRLLFVTGVPKYEILIYDLKLDRLLEGENAIVPVRHKFIKALFSPERDDKFAILYQNNLVLCEIFTSYEAIEDEEVQLRHRIQKQNLLSENSSYKEFIWDEQNNIYLADGFNVQYLDGQTLKPILPYNYDCQYRPEFLVLTQKHIIVVQENGKFQWLFKYDKENENVEALKPFKIDKNYTYNDAKIVQLMYNQQYSKIYVGTNEGNIIILPIEAESNDIDEEEEQAENQNDNDQDEQESIDLEVEADKLGPFHVGSVSFIQEFQNSNIVVSCSQNGRLFFWDIEKRVQISQFKIKGDITSADLSQNDQVLVLGSSKGVIRVIDIFDISICWNNCAKLTVPTNKNVLFILQNYFLISVIAPDCDFETKDLKLENENCVIYARKVDADLTLIQMHPNTGDLFLTGKDKILKRYKQPEELLQKMDTRIKQGGVPLEEQDGHPLPCNVMVVNSQYNYLISGSQDGTVFLRNLDKLQDIQQIKAHNWKNKGVCSLCFSKKYKILYTGGYDGSFFIWNLENRLMLQNLQNQQKNQSENMQEIEDQEDEKVRYYQKVLEEEFIKSQKEIREKQKQEIIGNLNSIKQKLRKLIQDNENADELEKLNRDEFVIDIETKNQILEAGKYQRQQLKSLAKRENYKQEILHQKIKEKTWDTMKVQLKGINGLKSNQLLYNFHIRNRTEEELQQLKFVKEFRRLEIREKKQRKENSVPEIIQIEDFIKNPSEYIVNSQPGKQKMVLIDYEKKEETKEDIKGPHKPGQGGPLGGRARQGPIISKKDEKKVEEVNDEQEKKVEEKEEEKKEDAELNDWDYLYGVMELFTNNRKKNQIVLLQNIIFKIKEEFNKEFDKIQVLRQSQVDLIAEKVKRVEEILNELRRSEDLFQPNVNLFETPENILKVDVKEIHFEKYLTREEREKMEKDRLREEERIRLLMQDDAGVRALKDMMAGTLEEKKENLLDEGLDQEDWMKKPVDEMNEEERVRLKEFEDICLRFDEKLLLLFRKKLEYNYRVYEQELYITRLSLSILQEKDTIYKKDEYAQIITKLEDKLELLRINMEKLSEKRDDVEEKKNGKNEKFENYLGKQELMKKTWQQVFPQNKKEEQKKHNNKSFDDAKYKNYIFSLFALDPYIRLSKQNIKKIVDNQFESYIDQIKEITISQLNQQNFSSEETKEEHMKNIIQALQTKFQYQHELEELKQNFEQISNSILFFSDQQNELGNFYFIQKQLQNKKNKEQQLYECIEERKAVEHHLEKCKSNIEILFRFKQGYVEIPYDTVVPKLQDAILIHKDAILSKNKDIEQEGAEKIQLMNQIKDIKLTVAELDYELKKKDIEIEQYICQTREVQLLRVKKEMQIALAKQDTKINEVNIQQYFNFFQKNNIKKYALKNLQDQIDMLRQATDKRIGIYDKKCKKIEEQIEFIRRENEQLRAQGNTVQTEEKFSATFKKNAPGTADDQTDIDSFDKFKQIAINRSLYTKVKRQTEEIELLREELGKLKARTFANFSNVQK
ncbi:hypothetical protein IMG5_129360, partial [Ichthyophthirius multifiliis]